MPHTILFSETQIRERIAALAEEIESALPQGGDIIVLALLNGALWFSADLLRRLPPRFILKTLKISSYGSGTATSGHVALHETLEDFSGKNVLVLDDVIDSGLTLLTICQKLREQGVQSIHTAVAVNKRGNRLVDFEPDFSAFAAGHEFIVGYGMDCGGQYRNLPFIAVLNT